MIDRSASARAAWARRKADPTYQTEAERLAAARLDDLRKAATAANVQARFGTDLQRLAEWCVSTCIAGGSSVHTAYLVAGTFTEGLSKNTAFLTDRALETHNLCCTRGGRAARPAVPGKDREWRAEARREP